MQGETKASEVLASWPCSVESSKIRDLWGGGLSAQASSLPEVTTRGNGKSKRDTPSYLPFHYAMNHLNSQAVVKEWKEKQTQSLETWALVLVLPFTRWAASGAALVPLSSNGEL